MKNQAATHLRKSFSSPPDLAGRGRERGLSISEPIVPSLKQNKLECCVIGRLASDLRPSFSKSGLLSLALSSKGGEGIQRLT
jgi:hypothetical protein